MTKRIAVFSFQFKAHAVQYSVQRVIFGLILDYELKVGLEIEVFLHELIKVFKKEFNIIFFIRLHREQITATFLFLPHSFFHKMQIVNKMFLNGHFSESVDIKYTVYDIKVLTIQKRKCIHM